MQAAEQGTILVTGATDGIGKETALALARRGARVWLHGRNPARLKAAVEQIQAETQMSLPAPLVADFSSLEQVRAMAAEIEASDERVTVLINNAGVFMNQRQLTDSGYEMTMAVNHLAPFLLTHCLLAGKQGQNLRRIINVSSIAHTRGKVEPLDVGGVARPFDGYGLYAASKLANVLFTVELAARLQPRNIKVHALHPGVVSTKLLQEGFGMEGPDSVETGAATSVMLALDPVGEETTGRYFAYQKEAKMHRAAEDEELVRAFYENSARAVGVVL